MECGISCVAGDKVNFNPSSEELHSYLTRNVHSLTPAAANKRDTHAKLGSMPRYYTSRYSQVIKAEIKFRK